MTDARMTDARLRELYEQRLRASDAGERAGCATPEAMLAVVRREGSEEERLATLDHVMSCGECVREFELLRAFERAGTEPAGAAEPRAAGGSASSSAPDVVPLPLGTTPSWRRFVPLALAASLVLAVGIGLIARRGGPDSPDVTRGGEPAVTLLAPGLEIESSAPLTFVWRPVAGATRYELEVLDVAGAVVFTLTTRDTTAVSPRRLTPRMEYRWWVRAFDAAGAQRASEMRRVRVRSE